MRPIFQVKMGFVQKSKEKLLGSFDLNRFVKWMLKELNVTTFDKCCDDEDAPKPVRLRDNYLEVFTGTEWEELSIPLDSVNNLPAILNSKNTIVDDFPASPTAPGLTGHMAFNATHGAVCIAPNTWVRFEIETSWI